MLSGKEGGGGQFARNDLNLMYLLINLLEFLKFFCFFLWWEGGGGGGGGFSRMPVSEITLKIDDAYMAEFA